MEYAYQNSTIAQILEAILGQGSFDGDTSSDIAEILLSILYATPYTKEPKSTIADLLIRLKAKIEGDSFEPYDGPYEGQIAEIIIATLEEAEYTKAPRSRIAELFLALKAEIESYAEVTVSGAIANFTTSLKKPLVNLAAIFQATQESGTPTPQDPKAISGVSAVSVIHTKENLVDIRPFNEWVAVRSSYFVFRNCIPNTIINVSLIDKDTSVDLSGISFGFVDSKWSGEEQLTTLEYRWFIQGGIVQSGKRNISAGDANKILTGLIFYPQTEETYNKLMARYDYEFELNSVSEYHAYGGSTTLINLGGTYYGGELSQDKNGKRKIKVTMGFKTANDIEFKRSNNGGLWANYLFYGRIVERMQYYTILPMCNKYQVVSGAIADLQDLQIVAPKWTGSDYIYICDNNYTTPQDFVNANQDLIIVYELAEPFEIDLPDGSPIIANVGVNNIYNDAGDTSVTYLTTISDNIRKAVNFKAAKEALKKQKELEKELEIKEPELPEKKEESRK
jgi:hypothetical protein